MMQQLLCRMYLQKKGTQHVKKTFAQLTEIQFTASKIQNQPKWSSIDEWKKINNTHTCTHVHAHIHTGMLTQDYCLAIKMRKSHYKMNKL